MRNRGLALTLGAALMFLTPSFALAQDEPIDGLAGLLLNFFSPSNPVILANPPPGSQFPTHAAHFASQGVAQDTMQGINSALIAQLSTFPLGSSSGSFTYTYDPALGVFNRSTETFGPLFAERAQTNGRGKFNLGVYYQFSDYSALDGTDLEDGSVILFLTHADTTRDGTNTDLFFEGDIIESRLYLTLKTDTIVALASYGITERFDIGVGVPIQAVDLDARIHTSIQRLSTAGLVDQGQALHVFPNGTTENDFFESGSASGIGDVIVRAKYNFRASENHGFALAVDARLPTGREEDLLGSGAFQIKPFLIASGGLGKFFVHANLGGTFAVGESDVIGDLPSEFDYTLGFDTPLSQRVSLIVDVLGRSLLDTDRLTFQDREFRFRDVTQQGVPNPAIDTVIRRESLIETSTVTLLQGAFGLKFNPFSTFVLSGNVFVPLNDSGLQSDVTVSFGADYSF